MAQHSDSDIRDLISKMTDEEKCSLLSGNDFWHTKSIERLGIPSIMVSDGPHGLRTQDLSNPESHENDSIKAVCFPPACASSCSFDRALYNKLGQTLGDECQAKNVSTLLGPAVNIKRSPLCGRNFEYISEDPYVAGELSASYINGVQSKHVGTSLKHFALNNQEYRRFTSSSNCDERALNEIYLAVFEKAVRLSQPKTVMHCYNRVNGAYVGESKEILRDTLRKNWGFKGVVMSDWGAVDNRIAGVKAGQDLEMPSCSGVNDKRVLDALKEDRELRNALDETCFRILRWVFDYTDNRSEGSFDLKAHHEIARQIEEESIVLLKNDGFLPLKTSDKFAVIGEFAKKPRFQGGGSSHIYTDRAVCAVSAFQSMKIDFEYAQGFEIENSGDSKAKSLREEALSVGKKYGKAVVFAGLPDSFECEGYDRDHLDMPQNQNDLINALIEAGIEVCVVMHNGSPVVMPWRNKVNAIVEAYLGGEAVGEAVVNVLTGKVNPSGKLAESFPLRLEDTPSYLSFANDKHGSYYSEGIFVGYRYYDIKKMDVQFPFGFGLSYTTFEYSDLILDKSTISDGENLRVTVNVKNTGSVGGKEVVQLYVKDNTKTAVRPEKELKGFEKVYLAPGESKIVSFILDKRSFAYFNTDLSDWYAAPGEYEILIGSSSRDIRVKKEIAYKNAQCLPMRIDGNTTFGDLLGDSRTHDIIKEFIEAHRETHNLENEAAREAITPEMMRRCVDADPLRVWEKKQDIAGGTEYSELIRKLKAAVGQKD